MSQRYFMEIDRISHLYRPVQERKSDFDEVEKPLSEEQFLDQARRCLDCGIPFCHGYACPLCNPIPDCHNAIASGDYREAWKLLSSKNPFPEITGRICPALCEGSCCASLNFGPVMIRQMEKFLTDYAFEQGWVTIPPVKKASGRKIAVIGSGPAGLAAADRLLRLGHAVTVFEKNTLPGGLLRQGIPEFKLPKFILDRRLQMLQEAGVNFRCNTEIGLDLPAGKLLKEFSALLFCTGTPAPRDLQVEGRNLSGIHFAMEYLWAQNQALAEGREESRLSARGKKVLVIGGGDTGSDCVGTAIRQGALQVRQIEIMPKPASERAADNPWPQWPKVLRSSSSHEEGCERRWQLQTIRFIGNGNTLTAAEVVPVTWQTAPNGRMQPVSSGQQPERLDCDLVFLALGFLKTERAELLQKLQLDDSAPVFLAGDCVQGPSLVVRAMADGIRSADQIQQRTDTEHGLNTD